MSASGWGHWEEKPLEEIREALWEKAVSGERMRKSLAVQRQRTVVEAARGEKLQGVVESVNRRKGSQTDTEETKATGSEAV